MLTPIRTPTLTRGRYAYHSFERNTFTDIAIMLTQIILQIYHRIHLQCEARPFSVYASWPLLPMERNPVRAKSTVPFCWKSSDTVSRPGGCRRVSIKDTTQEDLYSRHVEGSNSSVSCSLFRLLVGTQGMFRSSSPMPPLPTWTPQPPGLPKISSRYVILCVDIADLCTVVGCRYPSACLVLTRSMVLEA